jgi:hypothetical protein
MDVLASVDWNVLLEPPAIVFVAGAIIAVAGIAFPQWRKAVQAREEARLKEQMIQRGFSPDEIERVIRASATEDRRTRPRP